MAAMATHIENACRLCFWDIETEKTVANTNRSDVSVIRLCSLDFDWIPKFSFSFPCYPSDHVLLVISSIVWEREKIKMAASRRFYPRVSFVRSF
jgi:hypothetical protein